MPAKVEASTWPGFVPTAWWDRTLAFFCEGKLRFLCVLFAGKAQTDGSDRGPLRKPVSHYKQIQDKLNSYPLDSKWSVWIVLVAPLSFLSPSFFWWRLEKILKWLCFVHLRGWRKADYKWMCNWKSSWDKEEIYTDDTKEFFMSALCCSRMWRWSCAWPALARGGPDFGGTFLGKLIVKPRHWKCYWNVIWLPVRSVLGLWLRRWIIWQ